NGLDQGREGIVARFDWIPDCVEFACIPETLSLALGQFAPGFFSLLVDVEAHVVVPDKPDSTIRFTRRVNFAVPASCDTIPTRSMSHFRRAGALRTNCALPVSRGEQGELSLSAIPPVELGGLQGRIECTAPFHIANVQPPSPGFNVLWSPNGR